MTTKTGERGTATSVILLPDTIDQLAQAYPHLTRSAAIRAAIQYLLHCKPEIAAQGTFVIAPTKENA